MNQLDLSDLDKYPTIVSYLIKKKVRGERTEVLKINKQSADLMY